MKKMIRFGVCMTLTASMLFSSVAFAAEGNVPKEKIDEVLVQTDASGNITQMQDYVTLVGANSTDTILDKTKLTDIKNMSGDHVGGMCPQHIRVMVYGTGVVAPLFFISKGPPNCRNNK